VSALILTTSITLHIGDEDRNAITKRYVDKDNQENSLRLRAGRDKPLQLVVWAVMELLGFTDSTSEELFLGTSTKMEAIALAMLWMLITNFDYLAEVNYAITMMLIYNLSILLSVLSLLMLSFINIFVCILHLSVSY
jgi:hypothetical protein